MNDVFQKIFRFNQKLEQSSTINVFIPDSFERPVLRHIILNNILEKTSYFSPPLLLGIQGSYGMGKTFMVKELCKRYNIDLIQLSASDFSGSVEAASRDKFRMTYEDACVRKSKGKQNIVILIDDFHLSISTEDDVGKTVNSGLLTSAIMNTCDNPWISNYRVPLILTGNNFGRVYGAVVRVGRMDLLSWVPSNDEKLIIVNKIFSSRFEGIDAEVVNELVKIYPNNSIAFFSQVAEDILLRSADNIIESFRASSGRSDMVELRKSLKKSVENMSSDPKTILQIAAERNARVMENFEGKSFNPNQV